MAGWRDNDTEVKVGHANLLHDVEGVIGTALSNAKGQRCTVRL